jgi:hypothetical protein
MLKIYILKLFAQEGKPPKAEKPRQRKRATGLKNVGEYEEGEIAEPQGEQYLLASLEGDLLNFEDAFQCRRY